MNMSNNTSSMYLLVTLYSLRRGLKFRILIYRIGRRLHKRRTTRSRTCIRVLYRGVRIPFFTFRRGIRLVTGGQGRSLRRTNECIQERTFRRLYERRNKAGVTATRRDGSGTRAVLLGVTEKAKLHKLYKVEPICKG